MNELTSILLAALGIVVSISTVIVAVAWRLGLLIGSIKTDVNDIKINHLPHLEDEIAELRQVILNSNSGK